MSQAALESQLKGALKQLEKSAEQIVKTRGYTKEVATVKMLSELIKEQLINEDSSHTARPVR